MTLDWGYLAGTALFLVLLIALVAAQIMAKTVSSVPLLGRRSWHRPRSARRWRISPTGPWASATPAARPSCFSASWRSLGSWYWTLGSIAVDTVTSPGAEAFYWAAITFSQTLGTALGDWMADSTGLGYEGGALVFAAALAVVAAALFLDRRRHASLLFWAAFILTRPLGATVGDLLDKPVSDGGLALSRPLASAVIAVFMVACILLLPQRAGSHSGNAAA